MGIPQDLAYAARRLRNSPLFTTVAALSLAVGIGALTAVFSLVDALLLRELPGIGDQDRLVSIHRTRADGSREGLSLLNVRDLADGRNGLDGLAAFTDRAVSLRIGEESRLVLTQVVTGNYFDVLGARPHQGRFFAADTEATPGDDPVAVISHSLWRTRFGADPGVVGREVHVNGHPFTVIGVAGERFGGTFFGFVFDLWIPASMVGVADPRFDTAVRERGWLEVIGRLAPGTSRQQASAMMESAARRLESAFPSVNRDLTLELLPLTGYDPGLRGPLLAFLAILFVVTLLVLVIACLNVANMLLARSMGRSKEVAIRMALGIGRVRLVRQMLCESMLLAGLAGILGIWIARLGIRSIQALEPPLNLPLVFHVELNTAAMVFAFVSLLAAGLAAGLVPALRASRPRLVPALQETAVPGGGRSRLRRGFVVAQVSVSLVLLVVTGLFLRTLQHAANADLGFSPENRSVLTLDARVLGSDPRERALLFEEIRRGMQELPGVTSAAIGDGVPLGIGGLLGGNPLAVSSPGSEPGPGRESVNVEHAVVGAGYLELLDIGLQAGRGFRSSDGSQGSPVVIVNRAFAEWYWPGEEVIGRRLAFEDGREGVVVGLTGTGKYRFPGEEPRPFLYLSFEQSPTVRARILVRHEPAAAPSQAAVRGVVRRVSPDLPVLQWESMEQAISVSLLPQRMAAWITGMLGIVGLVLTALGVYGVVAYTVTSRTREFGLRMCLGAEPRAVIASVIRYGVGLTAIGIGIGLLMAFAATRFLASVVFGVGTLDPVTFVGIPLLLIAVAAAASALPARQVTGINPADALRSE